MNALGIDISFWQNDRTTPQMFDPRKARTKGASFVGIKISQADWADPDYAANWANCRPWLYRMPYHFLTWDKDPKCQAEVFWSLIERDTYGLLPLICDFEWWKTTPPNAMDILYRFMERMRELASPLPLGIYTAKAFWDPNGSKSEYWRRYCLWLCDITGPVEVPQPWTTWDFHQHTFKLPGREWGAESLDLDGDFYNGTLEQMRARFNLPALEDMPATEPLPVMALQMRVTANLLNVRSGPGTSYPIVGSLKAGDVVEMRGIGGLDAWVLTECGWACVQNARGNYMEKA